MMSHLWIIYGHVNLNQQLSVSCYRQQSNIKDYQYPHCIAVPLFIMTMFYSYSNLLHNLVLFPPAIVIIIISFFLASAVMDGQTVTRLWRVMSRKQREESPWSCNQRWLGPSMTTTWSCVWTPTPGTPGSLSSGSTVSSAACWATHKRTRTTRKSAPVGDYREIFILVVH